MKILLILKKGVSLTGAGTYEDILYRELAKRHDVTVYSSEKDLDQDWDIAHCSDLKHLSLQVAKKLPCPLVVDAHDYYWIRYFHFPCPDFPLRFLFQKWRKIRYRMLFPHISAMILHGRFMFDIYDHPRKYLNFYFGLDYSGLGTVAWKEKENLILFVGGDYFRKGLPRLLQALPRVLETVPDARVAVIGHDHLHARLAARFLSRGLPVDYLGALPRSEVYRIYGKGKVLVLPSYIEALSLVSAEATMAGTPPVLARVGGMPEVVRDGETGFLFDPDDTGMFADQIILCLTERELSERLVAAGREFFSAFTIDNMMNRLEDIYADVLSGDTRNKAGGFNASS